MIAPPELEPKAHDPELIKELEAEYDRVRLGQDSKDTFIRAHIAEREESRQRIEAEREKAKQRIEYDSKLQILNHEAFFEHVSDIIGIQARELETKKLEGKKTEDIKGSLLMLDLDHFKDFNDTYGHPEGDEILKKWARMLEKILKRPGDFLGRFGGEEFVIYLTDTDSNGALEVAEQIKEEMRLTFGDSYSAWKGTASIGIRKLPTFSEEVIEKLKEKDGMSNFMLGLTKDADVAMYEAKQQGRNQALVWNETMKKTASIQADSI